MEKAEIGLTKTVNVPLRGCVTGRYGVWQNSETEKGDPLRGQTKQKLCRGSKKGQR
jgi:hypothetical protein